MFMGRVSKRKFLLFILPFLVLCLCKCKPEFSVNSDGEPFTVIYGLLNVSEERHYVKIFKSFVVDGSAYDVVKDLDRYSYIDSIEVYINEYDANNNLIRKIPMDTSTEIPKDSGLFLYPTQVIYVANAVLNKDYKYEIIVFNPYTKNITKVKAPVSTIGDVNITKPAGYEISITEGGMTFEFYTAENSTRYQLLLKYYYTEDLYSGTSRQPDPIVWDLGSIVDNTLAAGSKKSLSVSNAEIFFSKIGFGVVDDDNVKVRHTDSLVLEVHSAGKDWSLFIQSNSPTSGINQDRMQYSNIIAYNTETGEEKYATGIFSLRGITTRKYSNLTVTTGSRDSLFYGCYTGHLRFTDVY